MEMRIGRKQYKNSRAFKVKFSSLLVVCFLMISCATTPVPSPPQTLSGVIPTFYQRILETQYSEVQINSEPPGAKVYVDNSYVGTTPSRIRLSYDIAEAGVSIEGRPTQVQRFPVSKSHSVSLFKDGYEVRNLELHAPTDTCACGLYTSKIGRQPWKSSEAGQYYVNHGGGPCNQGNITVIGTGYLESYDRYCRSSGWWQGPYAEFLKPLPSISPARGQQQQQQQQQQQIIIEKSKAQSYLSVTSDPSEAEVYLDDSLIGTTPITNLKLRPGNYRLKVVKRSKSWERNILLPEEGSLQIRAELK